MNTKTTFFAILLVALLAPTEARRSAPASTPIKTNEQELSGLGLYGRGYPHAWGVDKSKSHNDVRNVVNKKNKKVPRRQGKDEEM